MTIKELIEILQRYPQEYEVLICNDGSPVKISASHLEVHLVAIRNEPLANLFITNELGYTIDNFPDAALSLILEVTDTRHGG